MSPILRPLLKFLGLMCAVTVASLLFIGIVTGIKAEPIGSYGPPLLTECGTQTTVITVKVYPTLKEVNDAYKTIKPNGNAVYAFTSQYLDETHFVLHVTPPRGRADAKVFYLWGHELAHAVCGKWHPPGETY